MNRRSRVGALLFLFAVGCGPSLQGRRDAALPAVRLLQGSEFDKAAEEAKRVIKADDGNSQAHAVAALTRYLGAAHHVHVDVLTMGAQIMTGGINDEYFRFSLTRTLGDLAAVDEDLAKAAMEPQFDMELCIACWKHDWNNNGRVDERDDRLLEIEVDADGKDLPEGDARRRPTFRFDVGDLWWARAMVSFQRALFEVLLAYKWEEMSRYATAGFRGSDARTITLPLRDKAGITRARQLILAGLDYADRSRRAYLAETDDDREWVPNPRQKSHPLPLPVDDALYQTWDDITHDLEKLARGEEGISVTEAAQLGQHQWATPPRGFINLGHLLNSPGDIVLPVDLDHRVNDAESIERALAEVFGEGYVKEMKATHLLTRVERMKKETDRGEDTFARKLRYLFWLN